MNYRSRQIVEAFQWTPGCDLPGWCSSNRLWEKWPKKYLLFHDSLGWIPIQEGDYIISDNWRIFRLSPADFAERYEVVK